jgi:hypothetical protein
MRLRRYLVRSSLILAALFLVGLARLASADSWFPPKTTVYSSASGDMRLTVTPRAIASPLAYFQDKLKDKEPAGQQDDGATRSMGRLERRSKEGGWEFVWDKPLVNEVAPVTALVPDSGQYVVTFDNWHSVGFGVVVAIYGETGLPMKLFVLSDFLPADYIEALQHTVSSRLWSGKNRLSDDGSRIVLEIIEPSEQQSLPPKNFVDLLMDPRTGTVVPADEAAWRKAQQVATRVAIAKASAEAALKAERIAPLLAPRSARDSDWSGYLFEAFFRADPNWRDVFPEAAVLSTPGAEGYQASLDQLRGVLSLGHNGSSVLMFGSPSEENLVPTLEDEVARLPTGSLKDVKVYVTVGDRNSDRLSAAFARAGALFVQLDPAKPIPQRKERLPE